MSDIYFNGESTFITASCNVIKSLLWNLKIALKRRQLSVLTFIGHVVNHFNESARGGRVRPLLFFFFLVVPPVYENVCNDRILLWHYT